MIKLRLLLFSFLLTLVVHPSSAQDLQWQSNHGGSDEDAVRDIAHTPDGGAVVVGETFSSDGDVSSNAGVVDLWVVKLDSAGSVEWERTYGGSSDDYGKAVIPLPGGGYAVCAQTGSSDGDVSSGNGTYEFWLLELDPNGSLLWEKTYGGSDRDVPNSMVRTSDGGYVMAGRTKSGDGDVSGSNNGMYDVWAVKTDSTGTLEWEANYGGSDGDGARSVIQSEGGAYYLACRSKSSDGDVSANNGGWDNWVLKLDASGGLIWEDNYGGSSYDRPKSVIKGANGNLFVFGSTGSNDGDVTNYNGGGDFWLTELGSGGALLSEWTYGNSGGDAGRSIENAKDGGLLMIGFSKQAGGDVGGNNGLKDYWLVKAGTDGSLHWERNLGGSNDEEPFAVTQRPDGGILATGRSKSADGDLTDNNGNYDLWSLELDHACDTALVREGPSPDTACAGTDALFRVTPEADRWVVSTQWQVDSGSGWTDLAGATDDSLLLTAVGPSLSGNAYRCVLEDTCGNADTSSAATLFVNPEISFTATSEDLSCNGSDDGQITVAPSGGTSPYSLSVDSGGSYYGPTDTAHTFGALAPGTYRVLVEDSLGCASEVDTVLVEEPPELVTDAGPDRKVCEGDTATIGSSPAVTGGNGSGFRLWSPSSPLGDAQADTPKAYPDTTTAFELYAQDSNGCSDADTALVEVDPLPEAVIEGDTLLTGSDSVLLDGSSSTSTSGGLEYQWTAFSGGSILSPDPTADSVYAGSEGWYVLAVTDPASGCAHADSVYVEDATGLEEEKGPLGDVGVYPNPAVERFTVSGLGRASGDLALTLYDARGRVVREKRVRDAGAENVTLRVGGLEPGLHLLRVEGEGKSATRKVVVGEGR